MVDALWPGVFWHNGWFPHFLDSFGVVFKLHRRHGFKALSYLVFFNLKKGFFIRILSLLLRVFFIKILVHFWSVLSALKFRKPLAPHLLANMHLIAMILISNTFFKVLKIQMVKTNKFCNVTILKPIITMNKQIK